MSNLPSVSVIILSYNNKKFLENCLESVFRSDYSNFEVVLVDNASTDGSIDFVKKRFEKERSLKVVRNSDNLGFAGGNNVGIRFAKGEYIVFLNNDTEVDKNWLRELVNVFETDNVGAAQCKLLSLYNKTRFDCAGNFMDRLGYSIIRGLGEEDSGQYDDSAEIFYAKGAALATRRRLLNEIGAFDEDYFLYFEDTDLCWRIWLSGYKIVFAPRSIVFHVGEASTSKSTSQRSLLPNYHKHKNHITTLIKNYELFNLVKYIPPVVFLKVLSDFASFRLDHFVRLKGILYNLENFNSVYKKRLKIQKVIRKKKDIFLLKKQMITPFNLNMINLQNTENARSLTYNQEKSQNVMDSNKNLKINRN